MSTATVPVPAEAVASADERPDETRGGSSASSLFVVGLLVGTLAVLPLVPWYRGMDPTMVLLSVVHIAACSIGATVAVFRRLRPCLLVASVFPYCWLAIPAVYQISHVQAAWNDPGVTLDVSATMRAQGIIALGQVAIVAAYGLVSLRRSAPPAAWVVGRTGRIWLAVIAAGMLLCALLLVPFVISAAGGVGALFSSRQGFNQALADNGYTDNTSPLAALTKLVPGAFATVATLLALYLVRGRASLPPASRRVSIALCLVGIGTLCIVANPFAFSRFIFLTCFGPVAMMLMRPQRQRAAVAWLVGCVFAFLLAYPAADLLRGSESTSGDQITASLLAGKDYDGFQQAINTVSYVDEEGISWGSHVVSGLLFFVPRSNWSAKAEPSSITVAQDRGYSFTNLSMPIPAEAYLDGGWPGVALLMGALGALFGLLDRAWAAGTRWSLVAAYMTMAQVGLWRGPFGSTMPVFGFAVGLLVLSLVLAARPSRRIETTTGG
ncbi:O-antigen polymerase [Nocardioides acrostichi]|uniref:Oligosaccharide repeat unit polymerase n=1 Tax=Nocardioides acrostichi TaxID=2784339 RepID=A0A930UZD5_9ACTN|nr:O-antigen polymerase [Nocardioides acrostichi]MBF4162537.1 oligosaccharide repeat unit polymerase [Nocardioides acrostichi]